MNRAQILSNQYKAGMVIEAIRPEADRYESATVLGTWHEKEINEDHQYGISVQFADGTVSQVPLRFCGPPAVGGVIMKEETTFNYWQGTSGTVVVCSDGRQANTVFGDGVNADGEIVGSNLHDELMEELWREPNSGDVDPSLVELGAQCVPDDIIEVYGFTEKAILAYVGETI